jgi:hypothetical protein
MSRIMKTLIGTAVLAILVIAACLLFIVGGPRPADPEGFRGRVRGSLGMRDNRIPPCHDILVRISLAKSEWADESGKTTNDTPTWNDLRPYFPDWITNNARRWTNGTPICPAGGTYVIGRVSETPKCSVGRGYSHSLLQ